MSEKIGKFIVFEGPDYSGKSTQIQLIKEVIKKDKKLSKKCLFLREPGGTKIGENIRDILLNTKNIDINFLTEMLLFEASRSQLMYESIKTKLKNGTNLFFDRFDESTRAYQVYARTIGKPKERFQLNLLFNTIKNTQRLLGLYPTIDLFILFDVDAETVTKRKSERSAKNDRLDQENNEFHKATREAYLEHIKDYKEKGKLVNTSSVSVEKTHKIVWSYIKKILGY